MSASFTVLHSNEAQTYQAENQLVASPASSTLSIPIWFPGKMYTRGNSDNEAVWKCMQEERLIINPKIANRFYSYSQEDMRDLYQKFFTLLHQKVRAINSSLVVNKLEYARFTPPWMRKHLSVSGHPICYLGKIDSPEVCVSDPRARRRFMGHRRMTWILAALYENEPNMSQTLLDRLTQNMIPTSIAVRPKRSAPYSRFTLQRRKTKSRREESVVPI